ncbi:hypothetical protein M0R45_017588 [Rubus argutus]|uniref:Agglutinin domain-containing protein n=1 Tax=Rubus argutus TaxID=59490 RepID=A0AAW1XWX0_RUBAR
MSVLLPPFIAIKSSSSHNYYLNYSDDSDSETCGFLKLNGENVFSPLAKFQVVTANTGTGLVHIRCSHNKKFLRAKDDNGASYITPEADEPEEDQSKWSCTLFEPTLADGQPDKVQFFHVQRKLFVGAYHFGTGSTDNWFRLSYEKTCPLYDIIDLESLVILPKHVAFKGDNGKYLGMEDQSVLFASTDKGTPTAWFEVSTDGDGRAQIRSYKTKTFLRYDNNKNGIWANTTDTTDDQTTFWPVKVDKNVIALLSFANNNFCGQIENNAYFNAAFPTISRESRLVLEELVLSRRIYNADFDLANAVIYGETPITMATANASNNTPVDNIVEFKFTYTQSKSSTWTSSRSWMVGMSVEVSLKIPFIGETGVTISGEYSGSYEWGETITSENSLETTYTATVPANSSISVSLMATKGICDVPYSYYQRDVLYNGKTVIYKKDDGLCSGVNSYNFRYEVVQTSQGTSSGSGTNEPTTYTEEKIVMPSEARQGQGDYNLAS